MAITRGRHRDDRGVVLVIFAAAMLIILVATAMVIDLGQGRFAKRNTQSAADFAGLAAGYYLAGHGSTPAVSNPRQACEAAIDSTQTNLDDFLPRLNAGQITAACAGFPATAVGCTSYSPVVIDRGPYRLTIEYPVVADDLKDPRFGGSQAGAEDGTDPCERMSIGLRRNTSTSFAGVIGVDEVVTNARSVIRGRTSTTGKQAPAFLMLERTDCRTLGNSVGGSGNEGIVVENNGVDPGVIHSDSDATTNCSGNTDNAYAIYGSSLSGSPSINVWPGTGGAPGRIQTRATNGKGAAVYPGGLSVEPETVDIIYSRKVVDDKYNAGTNEAIKGLHNTAAPLVRATTAFGIADNWAVMDCSGAVSQPTPAVDRVFVDCAAFNKTTTFTGFKQVVFKDAIDLKQDNVLQFPAATSVIIRGPLAVPKGRMLLPVVTNFVVGGGVSVSNNSHLAVNTTSATSPCPGPPSDPTTRKVATFSIFGGDPAFTSAGELAICQTTVYLGGPKNRDYSVQQSEAGGTCSADKPCPLISGNLAVGARFVLGGGTVYWEAPNRYIGTTPPTQGLEDLALWAEGAGVTDIGSGSTLRSKGVFFAPNSSYEVRSPASGLPVDAQFIARKLFLFQGTMRMQPDKNNAVTVDIPGNYGLIR